MPLPRLPFPQYPHEESNETPKDKHGDAIEWARLVYLVPNPHCQLQRGLYGKGCLSRCILLRLQGFQISDNLPQPRNRVPVEPEKHKIFSALLAPNFARRSLTTNFWAEKSSLLDSPCWWCRLQKGGGGGGSISKIKKSKNNNLHIYL